MKILHYNCRKTPFSASILSIKVHKRVKVLHPFMHIDGKYRGKICSFLTIKMQFSICTMIGKHTHVLKQICAKLIHDNSELTHVKWFVTFILYFFVAVNNTRFYKKKQERKQTITM